jgi:hypothetical protein
MTQDEIIEIARQAAAIHGHTFKEIPSPETVEVITAFYKLVTAKEREACAKMFDGAVWAYDYREIAAAIRARGEQA